MKKVLFFVAAAMTLSACVMETATPVAGDMETITFEAEASAQTKTTVVDGTKVYWCAGDQISVMGAAAPFTNALEEGETAAKTAFTGEVATADTYYAVYPAAGVTWNGTTATVKTVMRQTATAGTFANGVNITAANTTSQEKSFSFQNVLGYVKMTLPSGIKSVIVTANNGELLYSEDATIDCAANDMAVKGVNGSNCVTLFSYTEIAAGEYYIALLPGTYAKGLTFDFVGTDGKVATKTIAGPVELEAGHVKSVGTITGLDWTDPASGLENAIWRGKYVTGKWDNGMADLAEGRYDWSKAKAGDMLRVHGGATDPNKTPTMAFKNKSWGALAGLKDYYNDPSAEMSVTLTEEAVAELKDGGLIIQGDAYYFTAIELVPGTGAEDPGEDTGATVLWEGEFEFAGWNGWQELAWGAYDWSKCKPGNVLRISGNPTNPSADWWVLSLKVGGLNGWDSLAGVPSQYGKPGILYIELTQEIIDDLVARNGLVIQGDGYIMTKIELYKEKPAEVVLWEGEATSTGYSNCQLGTAADWKYSLFAENSTVRIYLTPTDANNWSIIVNDGQWNKWYGTASDGSVEGKYGHAFSNYNTDLSAGYIEFDVTSEMFTSLTSMSWGNLLILQSNGATFTKITHRAK